MVTELGFGKLLNASLETDNYFIWRERFGERKIGKGTSVLPAEAVA
jgi:hypothetical protein